MIARLILKLLGALAPPLILIAVLQHRQLNRHNAGDVSLPEKQSWHSRGIRPDGRAGGQEF
jgi:hypothetical protein